jgi:hypothetical protein
MYGHDSVYKSHDIASVSQDSKPPKSPSRNAWTTLDISAASYFGASNESLRLHLQFQAAQTRIHPPRLLATAKLPQVNASYLKSPSDCPKPTRIHHSPIRGYPQPRSTSSQVVEGPTQSGMEEAGTYGIESKNNFITPSSTNQPKAFVVASSRVSKRQRIPHTASERRYRQNLTYHLECLRQKILSLTHRHNRSEIFAIGTSPNNTNARHSEEPHVATLDKISDCTRLSKCEVLNSAVEYIGTIERENEVLRKEAMELRARVQGLQHWCDGARPGLAVKRGTMAGK